MKKLILFAFVLLSFTTIQSKTMADYGGDGYFYTALAPYGSWIDLNDGMTVWQPTMMPRNWEPYTIGHWEWTAEGWYWDSDEPFGYITYHYGRWYNDENYGWIWIPDDQWAPAWVDWKYDDDYVGWAPLSPYGVFQVGVGFHFTQEYHSPYRFWHFVGYDRFCDPYVYHYYAGATYKYRIYNGATFRNDYGYSNGRIINRGVGYDIVRERSGRPIRTTEVIRTTDPREVTGNKDNTIIKTYDATRNDILRNNVSGITIKKPDKRTTLDVAKVTLGERNVTGRNVITQERQTPVVNSTVETQKRDILEQQNRQKQQQPDAQNNQSQIDAQRQKQLDQQNIQNQKKQQRQMINDQNRQRQQQIGTQNRQKQIVQQRQNVNQQNVQTQQVQQRQNVNQQNVQRQQVKQRQQVDQQKVQRQQTEQKNQQTNQRNDNKDDGKDRR
ncbi:MAG: hypothetical protein P4L35_14010 [Ignavibacteriaceae bacterium]|nr:hypothetical protein [Ignavibacteriaceae bacterium]